MTLYLLVVGLAFTCMEPCAPYPEAPRVDFFLSQANAAKEHAAAPKGSARLFKVHLSPFSRCASVWGTDCLEVKELNVLPAQSYEVSDKASVEPRP